MKYELRNEVHKIWEIKDKLTIQLFQINKKRTETTKRRNESVNSRKLILSPVYFIFSSTFMVNTKIFVVHHLFTAHCDQNQYLHSFN